MREFLMHKKTVSIKKPQCMCRCYSPLYVFQKKQDSDIVTKKINVR